MAQIVLSQAGAVAGASLLPSGLNVFGQSIAGAAIGRAVGSLAGRAIDASLMPTAEGPRVKSLQVMESREGAGLPLVFGRTRIGGQVIWASRFREKRKERSAGKGGPKYAEYSYSVSFAVALCQGPITRVDQIWANGEAMGLSGVNWRLYHGDEAQQPDPLMEAIEGTGNVPAYRGMAYIVFEDLPLDAFGNRLPQLSFEVIRAGTRPENGLQASVKGVNIIPATGEFVYSSQVVRERRFPGIERALNMNNGEGRADFSLSIDQLKSDLPDTSSASLTVAWFADSLQAGTCTIKPGVETRDRDTVPYGWSVDGTGRGSAHLISDDGNGPNFGGTPADQSVIEGIKVLQAAGLAVTMSPFLLIDAPGFPWRGRIDVSADGTPNVRTEIDAFVGLDGGFGYRHFILHHARLAAQAGGVNAILIGSELKRLTRVRDETGAFPFVDALISIASEVRAIVGPIVKISYAADWTEYGAYVPEDGSGDVLFPLDPLWASGDVDFIGVDWYPPVGDWRDGDQHLDALDGYSGPDDPDYLAANMAGGEAYDWYYADMASRDAQIRTPISDLAYGEDWIFRQKDLLGWWTASHHERPGGVRQAVSTSWQPGMKPVRLTEIGFPAVDRGGNAPNLFYDPKSSESAFPPYSNGGRDDLFQRRALRSALSFWGAQSGIEQAQVWAWDGRPWPHYPLRDDVWSDGPNWRFGHWLNGRAGLIELSEVVDELGQQAGIILDADSLNGFVEGFSVDGITTLRSALAPLETAFELDCIERDGHLHFQHKGAGGLKLLEAANVLDMGLRRTRKLLDKVPGRLRLSYIGASGQYAPALVEVSQANGDRDFALQISMPLVLGEGHARNLADRMLANASHPDAASLSLGPQYLCIEPGDEIHDGFGQAWLVDDVADQGLARSFNLRMTTAIEPAQIYVDPEGQPIVSHHVGDPFFIVLDAPAVPGMDAGHPLIAATTNPWSAPLQVFAGPDIASNTLRAVVETPAGIGQLESDFPGGPLGRWDESSVLDLYMPGADLASQSELAAMNGGVQLLVQSPMGWELLTYRDAVLIAPDRWQLTGLLRGLAGSRISPASQGALVVLADKNLVTADLLPEEVGLLLDWSTGHGVSTSFVFENKAELAWSIGHLQARSTGVGWALSWTRRGPSVPTSWTLPEAPNTGKFRVESYLNANLVETFDTELPVANIGTAADSVRVAEIGPDGRVGHWTSIPLSSP